MYYEPVVNRCLPTTKIKPTKYPSFTQINNFRNMDADHFYDDEFGNNNKGALPPVKPPRKFQRRLSLRNSFSENPIKMKNGNGDYCVDVDHIHVGFKTSCKGEQTIANAEVQTTHLVPYRLRFWPRTDCDFKLSPSETNCALKFKCCLKILSQWILSQAGLTIIVVTWALIGAYAFYITEGPREQKQSETLATIQKNLSTALATELSQSEDHVDTWPAMIHKYFEKHETLFLDAVGAGFGEGGGGNIWTYPGCFLFSVSLLTTLGFGAPVPRTPLGRGTAVVFAMVGIPLHFLLVLNIGNLTAVKLQQLAFRTHSTDVPSMTEQPKWLKWLPFITILLYYLLGVVVFGVARSRDTLHAFMFPLDFTASGGVANVPGGFRICYALYLEIAVTLAAIAVSLIQASAGKGIVDVGLKWGLLTNT
ncbi:potassium channel subfamily K member 6-like isoform X2 [Anthonomus grandis grandis]|uniref:potassium channel subfamily K member 6-like isoform X2 n=1 Tax=Anthonomus grandis grandis TaxID=2921223 RepID=UPI002165BDD1|nr:potassium channel subfamily K member 6-like isoform X2 [Anthonomus grandis grandis]